MSFSVRLESTPSSPRNSIIQLVKSLDEKEFPGCEGLRLEECYIWVVWKDARAVGYATMRYLPVDRCGYFSRAAIIKEYRRNGLHKRLVRARISYAKRLGWKGVLTYVSPVNVASVNSLFKLGFQLYLPEWCWAGKEFLYLMKVIP